MPSIEIFVATHKRFDMPTSDAIYIPMFGGAKLYPDEDYGYQKDSIGENISEKKEFYNELTTMYWAWKNSTADYKGLCHYRRFFYNSDVSVAKKDIISSDIIIDTLQHYDIILPYPYFHKGISVYDAFSKSGVALKNDLDLTREVISNISPEYLEAFDTVMKRENVHLCNSLIAKRDIFDAYSRWLFSTLFEVEKHMVDLPDRDAQQRRAMGFIGERLLDVWVTQHNLKIKHYAMHRTDEKQGVKYYLRLFTNRIGLYRPYHSKEFY